MSKFLYYFIFFLSIGPLSAEAGFFSKKDKAKKELKVSSSNKEKPLLITGAGASFPYILYSKWFLEYRKVNPNVMINYRSIGSGGGIRQFLTGTLDFGATDVPMSQEQLQKSPKKILHLPTALGAVVMSYNLPSLQTKNLRFTAQVLADMYSGKIKKWNDDQIQKINPGVNLPDQNVVPVYRADGSGTTAVFTEYLSQFSTEWLQNTGKGKSVNWQTGMGGKGNEGVMGLVQKIPGAIGYVAMSYTAGRKLPMGLVQNQAGYFIQPTLSSVKNSAHTMWKKTKNLFQPLVSVTAKEAYPMSAYTYLLVEQNMPSSKRKALMPFLNWYLSEGQKFCEKLHYIPLPPAVIQAVKKQVQSIKTLDPQQKT